MFKKHFFKLLGLISLLMVIVGTYSVFAQSDGALETLQIEVAEDGHRFAFGQERLHEDGMPDYGTPFVTEGYLYPAGTLNGTNGVLDNGEPEFPDEVIGTWTCWGWMIGDGMYTETGAWVVSNQIYQFNEAYGNASIMTDGFELADVDVEASRAITGGTGDFVAVSGEQTQTLHGFNERDGVVLTVVFNFGSNE